MTSACSTTPVPGAVTPFVIFEGEAGTPAGGAQVVTLTAPPSTWYASPELEASGHAYVKLNANGQSVQWTNTTGFNITGINLRSSIPDAPTGGGISATIDLYVNGVFRQAFPVDSLHNYCYENQSTNYNDQTDKDPSTGQPRFFWNDTHAFVSGTPIAPGSTFSFKLDSASNTAAFYGIDVVDVENVAAAIPQPANSLSITNYGAVCNDSSVDNTNAINNCFAAAKAQGKVAWIPQGTFYFSAIHGGLQGSNITVQGAGPWYSSVCRVVPPGNTQGIANVITTQSSILKDFAIDTNASSRAGNNNNGAVNSSGDNWLVDDLWIQHVTSAFWCAGSHGAAQNCRVLSVWSDGGNFNNVEDARGIGEYLSYQNNFVRGAGDDSMAVNSVNYNVNGGVTTYYTMMHDIIYRDNTAVAPWGGKGLGIYGGANIVAEHNRLQDTARYLGLGVMKFGANGSDLISATVTDNLVLRCGGNGYGQQQQAMMIGNGGDGQGTGTVQNAAITYNTIDHALFDAVGFSTGVNNVLFNNVITSPGLDGIAFGSQTLDLGTCSGSAVLLSNTVSGLNGGRSALLTQSGYSAVTPILAPAFNASSGVTAESCSEGGQDLGTISNASYSAYNAINLNGINTFIARVASGGAGGNIEVRLDSVSGTLLGTCSVPPTGCWQGWIDAQCPLSGASGTHTLYLVYTGGGGNLFNIEWFALTGSASTPGPTPAPTSTLPATATPVQTLTPTITPTPVPPQSTWRINAGGPALTDSLGHAWAADADYSGGNTAGTGSGISGTTDPALYQTERWGNVTYTFPVPAGAYQVTLKFAETYWTGPGQRVFNVSLNGSTVLNNFDIYAEVGAFTADDKVFNNVSPVGGSITITLGPASVDNAQISAIQIIPEPATPSSTPSASATATPSPSTTRSRTATSTATSSSTPTPTPTLTASATMTRTPTRSVSPSSTGTPSPAATGTSTATSSPSVTLSPTRSATASATPSTVNTSTSTPTRSPSPTFTGTSSITAVFTATSTVSASTTATRTQLSTLTDTPTPSSSASATRTGTSSPTASPSATLSGSPTATMSPTETGSSTPTGSPSSTLSRTLTDTPVLTATPTLTPTLASSSSATATGTSTGVATLSATASATPSASVTLTRTGSATLSPSPSSTPTGTLSPSASVTPSATQSLSPVDTASASMTSTAVLTATLTATPAWSVSASPTSARRHWHGIPKPLQVLPVPNPQGGPALHLAVELEADADHVELKLYSEAMVLVAHATSQGNCLAGWNTLSFPLTEPLSTGLYYAVLTGHAAEGSAGAATVCKLYYLR